MTVKEKKKACVSVFTVCFKWLIHKAEYILLSASAKKEQLEQIASVVPDNADESLILLAHEFLKAIGFQEQLENSDDQISVLAASEKEQSISKSNSKLQVTQHLALLKDQIAELGHKILTGIDWEKTLILLKEVLVQLNEMAPEFPSLSKEEFVTVLKQIGNGLIA